MSESRERDFSDTYCTTCGAPGQRFNRAHACDLPALSTSLTLGAVAGEECTCTSMIEFSPTCALHGKPVSAPDAGREELHSGTPEQEQGWWPRPRVLGDWVIYGEDKVPHFHTMHAHEDGDRWHTHNARLIPAQPVETQAGEEACTHLWPSGEDAASNSGEGWRCFLCKQLLPTYAPAPTPDAGLEWHWNWQLGMYQRLTSDRLSIETVDPGQFERMYASQAAELTALRAEVRAEREAHEETERAIHQSREQYKAEADALRADRDALAKRLECKAPIIQYDPDCDHDSDPIEKALYIVANNVAKHTMSGKHWDCQDTCWLEDLEEARAIIRAEQNDWEIQYDTLNEALKAENAALRAEMDKMIDQYATLNRRLAREIESNADREALEAWARLALSRYGDHDEDCAYRLHPPVVTCTCGYRAALDSLPT